ncbi:MAG: hypothetical protein LBQ48_08050 [Oscillospiraceae bacterium]|jgi:hypothetical protein|nr:hypothetical protein [Oscillospiraceae bacterium]
MDTFFEQIVPMKKTGSQLAAAVALWLAAGLIAAASLLIFIGYVGVFAVVIAGGAGYGAWFLSGNFSVEYEYSVTNGFFDIDRIVARRRRRRALSFECKDVEAIGKYNPVEHQNRNYQKRVIAGNVEENTWYLTFRHKEFGQTLVVFQPDGRVLEAVKKALPRLVAKDAFGWN